MEKVTFGEGLPGYETGPKTAPALVVIQEWWGVTEGIKETAVKLAQEGGFRTLVPDLYKGKIGVDAEEAHHLMDALDFPAAVEELKAAVSYLRDSGSPKVGVVGFCMGGALTFAAAQHANVDAAAPCYGTPNPAIADVTKITIPVQAHFGKLDNMKGFSDPETIEALAKKIKDAGVPFTLYTYDNSGHAFFNALVTDGEAALKKINAPVPPPEEVALAWKRLLQFFKDNLQ